MAKKSKEIIEQSSLLKALNFLRLVPVGLSGEGIYCALVDWKAVAFNRIIAAGAAIEEDLETAANTQLLALGIEQCGPNFKITQLSPEKLQVRSGDFQAFIPCVPLSSLSEAVPDPAIAPLDDRLLTAIKAVGVLADAKAKTVLEACVQLNSGSAIATDKHVILQAWHGIDLPNGMLIPKIAVVALCKAKKSLYAFGYSGTTATFYFVDGTWIRTNLFQEKYPEVNKYLNVDTNPRPVPPDLFKAARQIAPFSGTGEVFIKDGHMSSHSNFGIARVGSDLTLSIQGSHEPRIYASADLAVISKYVVTWDETVNDNCTCFFGDNIRGAISSKLYADAQEPSEDEDIPF